MARRRETSGGEHSAGVREDSGAGPPGTVRASTCHSEAAQTAVSRALNNRVGGELFCNLTSFSSSAAAMLVLLVMVISHSVAWATGASPSCCSLPHVSSSTQASTNFPSATRKK